MQFLIERINDAPGDAWAWFNSLTRDEWMIVLAITAALGFSCMFGFGNRKNL